MRFEKKIIPHEANELKLEIRSKILGYPLVIMLIYAYIANSTASVDRLSKNGEADPSGTQEVINFLCIYLKGHIGQNLVCDCSNVCLYSDG